MSQNSNTGIEINRIFPSQVQKYVTKRHLIVDGNIKDIRTTITGLIFQDTAGILNANLSPSSYNTYFSILLLLEQNLERFGENRKEFYLIKGEGIPVTIRVEKIINQELFQKVSDEIIKNIEETGSFSDDYSEAYKFLMGTDEEADDIDIGYAGPYLYPQQITSAYKKYLIKELSNEIFTLFDIIKFDKFLDEEEILFLYEEIDKKSQLLPRQVQLTIGTKSPIGIMFSKLSEDKKNKMAHFIKLFAIQGDVFNGNDHNTEFERWKSVYELLEKRNGKQTLDSLSEKFGFDLLAS